jgi:hypothetical protein
VSVLAIALGGAREIGRGPGTPIPVSDAVALALLAGLEGLAIVLVWRIWRERGSPVALRIFWTVVTLVPVLGLIAHAAWRDPPPPPADPTDRRRER